MMDEKEKALEHDKLMEVKFKDKMPTDICREFAAREFGVSVESTYVVMFSFVLGGYKAFCSSSELDDDDGGQYVEVVYNGEEDEFYTIRYKEANRRTWKNNE